MWIKLALFTLLVTGLALADDRSDYDLLKVKISEQRRVLDRLHHNRQYSDALSLQKNIAELSREALQIALQSPEIVDSGALRYHANVLRDAGYPDEALQAINRYMKTPLLKRYGFREGWTKRAEIYRAQTDYGKAQESLDRALEYADSPREQFQILRIQARLHLKQADPNSALTKILEAQQLIPELEAKRQPNAQRDVQSLFVQAYRELGESEKAREAKLKELELRRLLLDQEIDQFHTDYPPINS